MRRVQNEAKRAAPIVLTLVVRGDDVAYGRNRPMGMIGIRGAGPSASFRAGPSSPGFTLVRASHSRSPASSE